MSAVGIIALIVGLGVTGYIGYDIYKAATAPTGLQKLADEAKGYAKQAVTEGTNTAVGLDHYLAVGFNDAFGWI